ncbi:ornithine racemase Orr [Fundicoccus culcitae]|uniref:Ornithine racemase Orr n=1 Tax=Fundicoccus culcitae TaxID=2969821 RepID=A0ABY5P4T7_9LACT|nr:ornithine racemase Orr [Fundicoccus culcitae]UUX33500.1 ornithine racemase Orr [Fundicoccus culcitae]
MQYPRVTVDRTKLKHNLDYLSNKLKAKGIQVAAVTKVFSAYPELVALYADTKNVAFLADSRLENFANYPTDIKQEKLLLRIPMLSQVQKLVETVDISLNSQLETIQAINQTAQTQNKYHKIILMIDLGDLREGIFEQAEIDQTVEAILKLPHIELIGIGVNLTCYGAIIPNYAILQQLVEHKQRIEATFNIQLDILSGGNSSTLYLLDEAIPPEINQLRIGEAFVLGVETAFGKPIPQMHQDVFTLEAEIIEYRDKPSLPIGQVGQDAFGQKPTFVDKGTMRRGILALGKQDVDPSNIKPRDKRLEIIGASSDHLILDFTQAKEDYQLGDTVQFDLTYGSLLNVFTSKYVAKVFI